MVSGMQMVKSHDLANHLNIVHFGALIGFFSPVFRPTFEYWTQIYHSNTRLVRYSDGYCISSLVFSNSDTHNHGTEHHNGQTIISFRSQFKKNHLRIRHFFTITGLVRNLDTDCIFNLICFYLFFSRKSKYHRHNGK